MDTFDVVIRLIGVVCTVIVGITSWQVFRAKVNNEAEKRLAQIQVETIELQKETIAQLIVQSRIVEDIATNDRRDRDQCEKALRTARTALDAWDRLVGNIWIESATKAGLGPDVPPLIAGGRASDVVDSVELWDHDDEDGSE